MRIIILTITFVFSLSNIFGQTEKAKLKISHLTGEFYIYITSSLPSHQKLKLRSRVSQLVPPIAGAPL